MLSRSVLVALILSVCLAATAHARQMEDMNIVVLRTIDKVSARTHTFEIPVDKTVKFGASLFIKARACRKSLPMDKTESAAFLQIWERKPHETKPNWVFSGWMFASSPSVSAMDHAVYDVWVIGCKNSVTSSKSQEFSSEETPTQDVDDAKAEKEEGADEINPMPQPRKEEREEASPAASDKATDPAESFDLND